MTSTLTILEAERFDDGSVELRKAGELFHRYFPWQSDLPSRATTVVYLHLKYFRLNWKPKTHDLPAP